MEEFEECEGESSSLEGEQISMKLWQKENKIRAFLIQETGSLSEDSFFKRMNLQSRNSTNNRVAPIDFPRESRETPIKNEDDQISPIYTYEDDFSEASLSIRPEMNIIYCHAVVTEPKCQISESLIQLPATPCSSFSLYRFRLLGVNETSGCNCNVHIKKPSTTQEKPEFEATFEFQYFCPSIKFEPRRGFLKAGEVNKVNGGKLFSF